MLCGLTLYWSYARVDVVALAVAVVAVVAMRARRHMAANAWMAAMLIASAAVIAVLPVLPLDRWFGEANRPRKDSLVTRAEIYESTIEQITTSPMPLVGAGIKERAEGLVASQGTHSTYLGLTYRGGLLCSVSFLAFLLGVGWRAMRRAAGLAAGTVCFLLVWCVTDDIDAGNLVPLAVLVAYGLCADLLEDGDDRHAEPPQRRTLQRLEQWP